MVSTPRLLKLTEHAVFIPDGAKSHNEYVRAITLGVLVTARTNFWLDEISQKLFECLNEEFPKSELVLPAPARLINV